MDSKEEEVEAKRLQRAHPWFLEVHIQAQELYKPFSNHETSKNRRPFSPFNLPHPFLFHQETHSSQNVFKPRNVNNSSAFLLFVV